MKIFIQARKDGYNILFPTPTPTEFYQFASDIQSASASNDAIYYGINFYTLAFANGGCIFTKYVIGYDIQRNNLGNVGISVFIPHTQKVFGNDVKNLLDELLNTYCTNYCPDNNISDMREDWLLFTSIADSYDNKLHNHSFGFNNFTPGMQDPAFHYYNSDSELIEYLDKPFQEEYSDFKQILLIDSNLQGAPNPLNVLKNSGVEVNPDLENKYYYLNNYNISKNIKISAYFNNNWNERSDRKGNNQIRAKWPIEIKYLKDYYKPIKAKGSISNLSSEIHRYLEFDDNNIRIKYEAFQPEPETKTFTFNVVTKKDGAKVTDAEIQVDSNPWQQLSDFTFIAEELGREHKIVARRGYNLFSDAVKIKPNNYSQASISLQLIEKRVVKIKARDQENDDAIWNFKVHITGKNFYEISDQIEFVGDEIDKEWNIQIEKRTEYYDSENKIFCPDKDGNEIIFKLKKIIKPQTDSDNPEESGQNADFKKNKRHNTFASKAKTFFTKSNVIAASTVIALVLSISILVLNHFFGNDKQPKEVSINKLQIKTYIEGDSLMLDKLNIFKEKWEKLEQDFITESSGGMFGGYENVDSSKWKNEWEPAYESINKAIKIRELINNKNIADLRIQHYYNRQLTFKAAIEKMDSSKYADVGRELGDISFQTLSQIAISINTILTQKENREQEQLPVPENEDAKKEESAKTRQTNEQQQPQESKPARSYTDRETVSNDKYTDIIQYIRGSVLDEATLREYKNTNGINENLKKSIQICIDFWALDGMSNGKESKTYYSFREKVKKDDNLNNSKLKAFLDKMCEEGVSPSYSRQDKKKGLQ